MDAIQTTLLVAIISGLISTIGIFLNNKLRKSLDKSQELKNKADTVESLLASVNLVNDNYDKVYEKVQKYEDMIEALEDNLEIREQEFNNKLSEKEKSIKDLEERLNCLIETNKAKDERIGNLEDTVKGLQNDNEKLKLSLEANREEFESQIQALTEENKVLTTHFKSEQLKVSRLVKQMRERGLKPKINGDV